MNMLPFCEKDDTPQEPVCDHDWEEVGEPYAEEETNYTPIPISVNEDGEPTTKVEVRLIQDEECTKCDQTRETVGGNRHFILPWKEVEVKD